jgi:amidase
VAANLCAVAIGTETDGSIVSPSAVCGVVGLKPTVGLVSRAGIIPISQSQDTAGPMARTIADVAAFLGALTGVDPRDGATEASRSRAQPDYTQFLDAQGLRGARLGVARSFFSANAPATSVLEAALDRMKELGATLVDFSDDIAHGSEHEDAVLEYEFKAGVNAYLAALGPGAPVHNLEEIIAFNARNSGRELACFGQETLIRAQARGPLTDQKYLEALANCRRLAREEGIDAVMDRHRLDAIVAPAGGPAGKTDHVYGDRDVGGSSPPAAVAGYPNIALPAGMWRGLPVGISFFGRAWSEPVLLKLAFAFEQATHARKSPTFLPTLD